MDTRDFSQLGFSLVSAGKMERESGDHDFEELQRPAVVASGEMMPSPEQRDAGDDDLLSIPLGQHDPTPSPVRKNFTASDDLILLRAVNMMKPWEAPKGTSNGIMKSFEKIACMCQKMNGFVQDKPGQLCEHASAS
ncbi:unnamed protein product [Phytophthora lilii]|uniref:Unnamed protein product n=1 Tax=Phytophthora lilii TaxID=2077276 RepID=A0A9W6WVQ4_9STRA|nr:unnamed protein product [Phytophthora lilii]